MTLRCRYETPMVVDGTPIELRAGRRVVGKKTGYFELREEAENSIVQVGSISRPRLFPDHVEYHAAAAGSGLYVSEGRLSGGTFEADSRLSVMSRWRADLVNKVIKCGTTELHKTWYPAACAVAISRDPYHGMRSLYELRNDQFSKLDTEKVDLLHDCHGGELASAYIACGGLVYRPEPKPFVAVQIGSSVTVSVVCGVDLHSFSDAVKIFPIADVGSATVYGEKLAVRHDMTLTVSNHTLSIERPEFFDMDASTAQVRITGNCLMSAFLASVGRLRPDQVALQVPMIEIEMARALRQALDERGDADATLESAIEDCVDYQRNLADNRFMPKILPAAETLVVEWRDRAVDFLIGNPAGSRPPGFL